MDSIASLPRLPNELISEIISYMIEGRPGAYASKLYPLYALRLTCRALYTKTFHDFTKAAFSTIFVDLSVESLDRLHGISQHPEISKKVKCIYFNHDAHQPVSLGLFDEQPGFPLQKQVEWLLSEGFTRVFQQLSNLEKVVMMAPFMAIFSRGWHMKKDPSSSSLVDEVDSNIQVELPPHISTDRCYITTSMMYAILMDTMEQTDIRLKVFEVFTTGHDRLTRGYISHTFGICIHAFAAHHRALAHVHGLSLPLSQCDHDGDLCTEHHHQSYVDEPGILFCKALNNLTQLETFTFRLLDIVYDIRKRPQHEINALNKKRREEFRQSLPVLNLPLISPSSI